jgi:hypothetical protein
MAWYWDQYTPDRRSRIDHSSPRRAPRPSHTSGRRSSSPPSMTPWVTKPSATRPGWRATAWPIHGFAGFLGAIPQADTTFKEIVAAVKDVAGLAEPGAATSFSLESNQAPGAPYCPSTRWLGLAMTQFDVSTTGTWLCGDQL